MPNGASNIATFDLSNTTETSLSAGVEVKGIMFNADASAFQISTGANNLKISGGGLINTSANAQQFVLPAFASGAAGTMQFFNSAGTGTVFTAAGSLIAFFNGGVISFFDSSTAGEASFILQGGGTGARTIGGRVVFMGGLDCGERHFCLPARRRCRFRWHAGLYENAGAGHATITAEADYEGGDGNDLTLTGVP